MSRYIDADKLLNRFMDYVCHDFACKDCKARYYPSGICRVDKMLRDFPTANVVKYKVLRLLLDWAIECGFGYDSIPEEYEKYKDDIQDMSYADGLIYIAMKEVEDEQIH